MLKTVADDSDSKAKDVLEIISMDLAGPLQPDKLGRRCSRAKPT